MRKILTSRFPTTDCSTKKINLVESHKSNFSKSQVNHMFLKESLYFNPYNTFDVEFKKLLLNLFKSKLKHLEEIGCQKLIVLDDGGELLSLINSLLLTTSYCVRFQGKDIKDSGKKLYNQTECVYREIKAFWKLREEQISLEKLQKKFDIQENGNKGFWASIGNFFFGVKKDSSGITVGVGGTINF